MATSFTYAAFETALKDAIEDQGSEFDGKVDELIQRGEDRALMDLGLVIFDAWDTISFASGQRLASLPTDFLAANTIYYTGAAGVVFLERRTQEYILDYWPTGTTATPKFFAPYSATQIMVGGTPGASPASGQCHGIKRPTSLVADAAGTWLSKNVGTLLLHAVLIEALKHVVADERVGMVTTEYGRLLTAAQNEFRHLRRPDDYLKG